MITSVVMPQMGLEVTEGTVAAIQVAPGDNVSEGDALIEMETDKAVTDVVAPHAGVVRSVEVQVGDTVAIGAALVLLADNADEPLADTAPVPVAVTAEPEAAAARESEQSPAGDQAADERASSAGRTSDGRLRAAPVARRAAAQLGVDLEGVDGTGPRGRITLRDVERVAAASTNGRGDGDAQAAAPVPSAAAAPREEGPLEPMTPMRRAIARRMTLSQQIPQFTLTREVEATWLLEQKGVVGHSGAGVNDMLLQAMAEVALRHPALAASYAETDDGAPALLHRESIDLGLAVATPRGLVVPVVRQVHTRSLAEIADERGRLVGDARSGRLRQEDMSGAAMTLSNLSSFGVDHFTAMLNPGESAILAVGRVAERVVPRGRAITVVPTLTFSLTIDHRVADGATGAAALVELAELLEGTMTWRT